MHSRSNDNCNEWSSQHVYTVPGLSIDTSCFTHLLIVVESNNNLNRKYTVYANGIVYQAILYSIPTAKNIANTSDAFSQPISSYSSFIGVTHNTFSHTRNLHSFAGAIDQLRFYNRALLPNEAISLYQEGLSKNQASLEFDDIIVCENQPISVAINSTGSCNLFYWILNGSRMGLADSIRFTKRATLPDTVQVIYQYRSICKIDTLLQIFYLPPIDTVYRSICPNDSTFFNGKWYSQSGIFIDTIKTPSCDSIVILSVSTINFKLDLGIDRQLCIGDSVTLDASGPNQTYLWQDNSTASSFKVSMSGIYAVTVNNSCETKSDSVSISVVDCNCILSMPNVFTPNSDGINDLLTPLPSCITSEYVLVIYNRWGDKIFESSASQLAWDGTHAGKSVSEGVYIYSVSYKTLLGTGRIVNGSILLLR